MIEREDIQGLHAEAHARQSSYHGVMISGVKASAALLVVSLAACTPAPRAAWDQHDTPFALFVFLRTDCPISGRYAPELERLQRAWVSKGVRFELVYPDPRDDERAIEEHAKAFGLSGHRVRDPDHFLVQKVGATVTPEVALVDRTGELFYRGRI